MRAAGPVNKGPGQAPLSGKGIPRARPASIPPPVACGDPRPAQGPGPRRHCEELRPNPLPVGNHLTPAEPGSKSGMRAWYSAPTLMPTSRPPPPARRGSGDPSAPARPDLSEGRGCRRSPCGAAAEGFPWHRWDSRTLDLRAAGLPRRAGSRGGGRGLLSGGAGIPRGRWRAAAASPGLRSPLRRRSREGEVAARCEPPGGRGQRRGAALSFSASSRVTSG